MSECDTNGHQVSTSARPVPILDNHHPVFTRVNFWSHPGAEMDSVGSGKALGGNLMIHYVLHLKIMFAMTNIPVATADPTAAGQPFLDLNLLDLAWPAASRGFQILSGKGRSSSRAAVSQEGMGNSRGRCGRGDPSGDASWHRPPTQSSSSPRWSRRGA